MDELNYHIPKEVINFNDISKIEDNVERAHAYINLGTDALNRGEFTLSIDAFIEAINCSETDSLTQLLARNKIAKQFQILGHPKECIELTKQLEEIYFQQANSADNCTVDFINNRVLNLCLMLDSLTRINDYEHAKQILDTITKFETTKDIQLQVIAAHIQYYGGIHDKTREAKYLNQYFSMVSNTFCNDPSQFQKINEMITFLLITQHIEKAKELMDMMQKPILDSHNQSSKIIFLTNKIMYDKCINDNEQLNKDIIQYHYIINIQINNGIFSAYENTKFRIKADKLRREQKKMLAENLRLQKEAMTDSLVNLPNRSALDAEALKIFNQACSNKSNFAIEMLDIDYFKQLNDTYGHQTGDKALITLANCLKKIQQDNVFVSRYGGDEFCILYYNLSVEEIKHISESLYKEIEKAKFPNNNSKVSQYLTISQGIFVKIPSENDNVWDYLKKADNALYEIKETKRGSIMIKVDE